MATLISVLFIAASIAWIAWECRDRKRHQGRCSCRGCWDLATRPERPAPPLPVRKRLVRVPGLRADGEPLTWAEERVLGGIGMDMLIDVPEPVYGSEERGAGP